MLGNLNGWHLIIILAIVLLLFGAPRLPALAKSVGQSMKIFKSEIKSTDDEKAKSAAAEPTVATPSPAAPAPAPAPTVVPEPTATDTTPRATSTDPADTTPKP